MHTASASAAFVYRPSRLSVVERRSSLVRTSLSQQENDCYKMTSDPRGLALIISNINFKGSKKNRLGGEKDLDRLRTICEKLKLQQEIKKDLTAQQIEAVVKEVSRIDHSDYDCFVLFLLSHGTEDVVQGTDGQHVSVESIISSFQTCTSLVGKPKLFFIQACRGVDRDKGLELTDSATDKASSTPQAEASDGSTETTESPPAPTTSPATSETTDSPPPTTTVPAISAASLKRPDTKKRTLPTASDHLVMYATVYGQVSYRNSKTGTPLIQALADVIIEDAETMPLRDMLLKVKAKVAAEDFKHNKKMYKQQPEEVSTLLKKLYFFPEAASD